MAVLSGAGVLEQPAIKKDSAQTAAKSGIALGTTDNLVENIAIDLLDD